MFETAVKFILYAVAVLITSYILPGVEIKDFLAAIAVAIVLSLMNAFVKPLLVLFTIPVTVLTLGFFLLVINAVIVLIAGKLVPGFEVNGFWWALIFSIVLSFFTMLFRANTRSEFF